MITRHVEPVVHTEYSIQKLLIHKYRGNTQYLVPNMYYQLGEMDLFMLRRSGYAEEFEIKISTSDLKADAKKLGKHSWLQSMFKDRTCGSIAAPNRFSYVIGPNVSFVWDWLPSYAGIYRAHDHYIECMKVGPLIHKNKLNWDAKVAGSCSGRLLHAYKFWELSDK